MAPSGQRGYRAVELTDLAVGGRAARVAVAMSGGVDSSVAAARCVEAGVATFGLMLRLWAEPGAAGANKCCTLEAVQDARAVADTLGIPFTVLDAQDVFRGTVVDAFIAAAAAGDTPNPCFTCNRRVRFGYLLAQARALGADCLATGHYARVARAPEGTHRLLRGVDPDKDQSYVLHRLSQDQLGAALFPVGALTKDAVRAEARRLGLPVANRPDSVDLCWLGSDGITGFLGRVLPPGRARPGPIVDQTGRELGRHRGLPFYTRGQRRGLGVATGVPLYVLGTDLARNALLVGPATALDTREVTAADWHWIAASPPAVPRPVTAQVRYRAPAAPGTLALAGDGSGTVTFAEPQRAPAPGQGLVVYDGDECLGGGTIVD